LGIIFAKTAGRQEQGGDVQPAEDGDPVGAAGFQQEGIGHQAEAGAVRRADDVAALDGVFVQHSQQPRRQVGVGKVDVAVNHAGGEEGKGQGTSTMRLDETGD